MSIVIVAPGRDTGKWQEILKNNAPEIKFCVWPDCDDKVEITCAIAWNHPPGVMAEFPNLKLISSMGAGVDHIMRDASIAPDIRITRIVDDALTISMTNYVIMAVLNYHKQIFKYLNDKQEKAWDQQINPEIDLRPGVMGMGVLGQDVAMKLQQLGFRVFGYSNSRKFIKNITSYAGEEELNDFLSQINILICMLPLTSDTRGILNYELFRKMNKGSYLINVARGSHLVEEDLLKAIEEGYIEHAFLDVFNKEPLPKEHPFWSHNKIMITPHIASVTNPYAAVPQVIANYKRMMEGSALSNEIDRDKEY
jgi:glyoxylate/hydroxypyruvate reductase